MTFDHLDVGARDSCRIAQRLAVVLLDSLTSDDGSMRQLARDSGVDVTTVKSVLEGSYGARLETVVRLMRARGLPLGLLLDDEDLELARGAEERRIIELPATEITLPRDTTPPRESPTEPRRRG